MDLWLNALDRDRSRHESPGESTRIFTLTIRVASQLLRNRSMTTST
jgi:hypothetical protein